MTVKSQFSIAAFVSEGERPAVQLAVAQVERALSQAANVPWTGDCVFCPDVEKLQQFDDAAIRVTSFLTEIAQLDQPWSDAAQRLRMTYAKLAESGTPVFICTVLRHVGREEDPKVAEALRIRIRRLNLLAAEISRETGAYVIDLDRVLADLGARCLGTDYRLVGQAAIEMAAHFIALTLVNDALDALVSFEIQNAARTYLEGCRPAVMASKAKHEEILLKEFLQPMGQGRKKQIVSIVNEPMQEKHGDWLIRQVLSGKIAPADALNRLLQAFRERGIRKSAIRLVAGLLKQLTSRK